MILPNQCCSVEAHSIHADILLPITAFGIRVLPQHLMKPQYPDGLFGRKIVYTSRADNKHCSAPWTALAHRIVEAEISSTGATRQRDWTKGSLK